MANDSSTSFDLGIELINRGDFLGAERHMRQAAAQESNRAEVHYFLGACLFNLGRMSDAEKSLNTATQLDPRDAENVMMLGRCLMRQDKLVDAADCFKRGVLLAPDNQQYADELFTLTQLTPFSARLQEQTAKLKRP